MKEATEGLTFGGKGFLEVTFGLNPEELSWVELGEQCSWSRGNSKQMHSPLVNFGHAQARRSSIHRPALMEWAGFCGGGD